MIELKIKIADIQKNALSAIVLEAFCQSKTTKRRAIKKKITTLMTKILLKVEETHLTVLASMNSAIALM
jgi:hypothetical protein